jgi:hypothetical protein
MKDALTEGMIVLRACRLFEVALSRHEVSAQETHPILEDLLVVELLGE